MNQERQNQLFSTYRDGLLGDTLPFWTKFCVDREFGGFLMSLDRNGDVVDTDKGVWQQGRFTWLLGELYNNVEPREEWLELALHGINFIDQHCYDPADQRMWFHVTRSGQPIRKRRYSFSESFAAIAYGELAKATGKQIYAEKAQLAFDQFVSHSLDPQGVQPKFTGVRPMRGLGFPMITIVTAQELRDSIGLESADYWIDRSIADICQFHMKEDIQCVMESVSPTGEIVDSYDGRLLNPGHAIEGAWFIMHEGQLRGDQGLIKMGCKMLDWMWQRGWDKEHGGLLYFADVYDRPVQEYWHDMKFWWPHNEEIIATLMAWLLTGDQKYSHQHRLVHDWTYEHFPDPVHGEWFGYLHRDGSRSSSLKGNLWKGPFHMPRMQLVCSELLRHSGAPA
ncbi:MAG: AGE family epimerase/isomerase [Mariniblastus sp.]|nr:AGE family epimerase/isomerase [Mariniblastus sp.]